MASSTAVNAFLAALFLVLLVGVANGIRLQEKGRMIDELLSSCTPFFVSSYTMRHPLSRDILQSMFHRFCSYCAAQLVTRTSEKTQNKTSRLS